MNSSIISLPIKNLNGENNDVDLLDHNKLSFLKNLKSQSVGLKNQLQPFVHTLSFQTPLECSVVPSVQSFGSHEPASILQISRKPRGYENVNVRRPDFYASQGCTVR